MGRLEESLRNAFVSGCRRCDDLEPLVLAVATLSVRLCTKREAPDIIVECTCM